MESIKQIENYRVLFNVSKSELARSVDITRQYYDLIIEGKAKPGHEIVLNLLGYFGLGLSITVVNAEKLVELRKARLNSKEKV